MSTQRECKVIRLPAEGGSHIVINNYLTVRHGGKAIQYLDELIPTVEQAEDRGYTPQHLYVVSDDELNVGDWYIHHWLGIKDVQQFTTSQIKDREEHFEHYRICCKKIIATTDTALWLHDDTVPYPKTKPLPSLSTGFLRKYCELRGIDKILVDFEEHETWSKNTIPGYPGDAIVTPKVRPDNTIITHPVKNEWSREEVIKLLNDLNSQIDITSGGLALGPKSLEHWINKNL